MPQTPDFPRKITWRNMYILGHYLRYAKYIATLFCTTQEWHVKLGVVILFENCLITTPVHPLYDAPAYSRIVIDTMPSILNSTTVSTGGHLPKAPHI